MTQKINNREALQHTRLKFRAPHQCVFSLKKLQINTRTKEKGCVSDRHYPHKSGTYESYSLWYEYSVHVPLFKHLLAAARVRSHVWSAAHFKPPSKRSCRSPVLTLQVSWRGLFSVLQRLPEYLPATLSPELFSVGSGPVYRQANLCHSVLGTKFSRGFGKYLSWHISQIRL